MELFDAIAARHCYRGMYRPQPVPREDLRKILAAGLEAPSGCNLQTPRLVAVDDPAVLARLGDILGKANFASAPAAVCVFGEAKPAFRGATYWVQDYAAAIQNMLLALTALGYVSCWVEGQVTADPEVSRRMAAELGAPENFRMVAFLPVGVPASPVTPPQKMPFGDRAWFNGFGRAE